MASVLDTVWTPINQGWWGGYGCGYQSNAYGFGTAMIQEVDRAAPPEQPQKPAPPGEERTGPQSFGGIAFPLGFGLPLRASYGTYRQLLRIPSVALVRAEVFGSILSGSWTVDADEGAPESAKAMLELAILPQRAKILRHALRALDFGFSATEAVWGIQDGYRVASRFKPLRWERTVLLIDKDTGATVGVKQGDVELEGPEAWVFTYDGEPGDPRGRSRLENVREPASKWLEVQTKIGRLIDKESGAIIVASYPPGSGRNESNVSDTNRNIAISAAQNAANGSAYLAVENALGALTPDQRRTATPDQIVELLKTKLWAIENVNLGGNGPALAAMQLYSSYLDTQMIRGYLRPERSLIEGAHGTKAEAGVHTDTGTTDSECVEADIVASLNDGPVGQMMEENFGPQWRGKVRMVANPLRDVQESVDVELIHDVATNAATADEFYRTFDIDAVADRRGIAKRKIPLPEKVPPVPVLANGNGAGGRMNGNTMAALSRLFGEDE